MFVSTSTLTLVASSASVPTRRSSTVSVNETEPAPWRSNCPPKTSVPSPPAMSTSESTSNTIPWPKSALKM
jgi:hypothetical protein